MPLVAARALGALSGSVSEGVYQSTFSIAILTVWEWRTIRGQMRAALDMVGAMKVRDAELAALIPTLPLSLVMVLVLSGLAFVLDWDLAATGLGLVGVCTARAVGTDVLIRVWERRDAQRYLLRVDIAEDESLLREPR